MEGDDGPQCVEVILAWLLKLDIKNKLPENGEMEYKIRTRISFNLDEYNSEVFIMQACELVWSLCIMH